MRGKAGMLGANRENGWNISTAAYVQSLSVSAEDTGPTGIAFKPDGTRMYVAGNDQNAIEEYALSSAWDISTASHVQSLSVALQETTPTAVAFKPDGARMYVVGSADEDVSEYSMSTPWDISSASYLGAFSVSNQDVDPNGIAFKPDGTRMYVIGYGNDRVNEYLLSVAWSTQTATYVQSFSISSQDSVTTGVFFKPDGTRMYVTGATGDSVYEYALSVAWDISTALYVQSFSVASQDAAPGDIAFNSDGTRMYVVGTISAAVYEYALV